MAGHTDTQQLLIFWWSCVSHFLAVSVYNTGSAGNADVVISRMLHQLWLIFPSDVISLDTSLAKQDSAGPGCLASLVSFTLKYIGFLFLFFCCPGESFSVESVHTQLLLYLL